MPNKKGKTRGYEAELDAQAAIEEA